MDPLRGGKVWEKGGNECKRVRMTSALFADDTTIVGMSGEIDEGVNVMKSVMNEWEERNNDAKEEVLEFGTNDGANVRVLGSWTNASTDVQNRIKRANGLWWRVKGWLKSSRLTKKWQGRVVEACVESSLLYDCQARVWYKRDVKRLQKWMDKCYRYVWSDRNGQPLRQMQARGENMTDVRERLGVKSVEWKIERRVLQRIGHVLRMGNERMTKAMILGWYECLEGRKKMPGKKRKTVLYWKSVIKKAGRDWTDVERMIADKEEWNSVVKERMEHLYKWECQKGNKYEWGENEEPMQRDIRGDSGLICRYEGCGRVCKSKAGRAIHEKRMHRMAEERVRFACDTCGMNVETAGAKLNHMKSCRGGAGAIAGRRECGVCGTWISHANYARHLRACERRMGVNVMDVGARAGGRARGRVKECELCGRVLSVANMARHQATCRVWDPGGEPSP